jgi:hypothetical protein
MDTIGSVVDKLTIVNLKIWMLEDKKRDSNDDSVVADATKKTNVLNQQRNDLIQELDEKMNEIASGKKQKLYGQGENKIYGTNNES